MKTLFLIFAIVLISYQAVPGDAQAPEDTIACGRSGGGCQIGNCRPGFQNVGTCKGGAMSCCRWPRPGA